MAENADPFRDPAFIEPLRQRMVRFASLHLRDQALAEDAVQDALLGAFRNSASFGGRSAFATWVFGILKNKITDALRKRIRDRSGNPRERPADSDLDAPDPEGRQFFQSNGMWKPENRPADWGDPHEALESARFWRVFEACLDGLPSAQARVFTMRQMLEMDSTEICEAVGLSVSNLHVLLHRARLRLRACLDREWFNQEARRAVM